MKYLKKFNEQENSIKDWLDIFKIEEYEIDKDGFINVNEDTELFILMNLIEIPIKFGIIKGSFDCSVNKLLSLKNSPKKVFGNFSCSDNKLTSLIGGPKDVSGNYKCYVNSLIKLEGCPKELFGDFDCNTNILTTLVGGPVKVSGFYSCKDNKLTSLEGLPYKIGGRFTCEDNPIFEIFKLFGTLERYKASLDYNYLRGTNIIQRRFERACNDAEIDAPEFIRGYNYVL
jgi:hypothetical protein